MPKAIASRQRRRTSFLNDFRLSLQQVYCTLPNRDDVILHCGHKGGARSRNLLMTFSGRTSSTLHISTAVTGGADSCCVMEAQGEKKLPALLETLDADARGYLRDYVQDPVFVLLSTALKHMIERRLPQMELPFPKGIWAGYNGKS